MQTNIHLFPVQPKPRPNAHIVAAETTHPLIAGGTYVGIHYIGRELAMLNSTARTVCTYVRQLVSQHGFPSPRNPRLVNGQLLVGAEAVSPQSLWARIDVDHWIASRSGHHSATTACRDAAVDGAIMRALGA